MGNKKGQTHYPQRIKEQIVAEYKQGTSQLSLHKKYGISRWTIHCWCGLSAQDKFIKILNKFGIVF